LSRTLDSKTQFNNSSIQQFINSTIHQFDNSSIQQSQFDNSTLRRQPPVPQAPSRAPPQRTGIHSSTTSWFLSRTLDSKSQFTNSPIRQLNNSSIQQSQFDNSTLRRQPPVPQAPPRAPPRPTGMNRFTTSWFLSRKQDSKSQFDS
jgi:hypothetical protein